MSLELKSLGVLMCFHENELHFFSANFYQVLIWILKYCI